MFNFLHSLGVGIVSAFIAFTGGFHQVPTVVQVPSVQVVASSSVETPPPIVSSTVNKAVSASVPFDTSAEVQVQAQAILKQKADTDAQAALKAKIDSQTETDRVNAINAQEAKDAEAIQQAEQNTASQQSYNNTMNTLSHENDAAINAQQAKQNSPECLTATNAYNQINQQYTSVMGQENAAFTAAGSDPSKMSNISSQFMSQTTDLMIKNQNALQAKYNACETWQSVSPAIVNTSCNVTGSLVNCFSQ